VPDQPKEWCAVGCKDQGHTTHLVRLVVALDRCQTVDCERGIGTSLGNGGAGNLMHTPDPGPDPDPDPQSIPFAKESVFT
jgi:hypothetical protein